MRRIVAGVLWGLAVGSAFGVLLLAARIITDIEPGGILPAPSAAEQEEPPVVDRSGRAGGRDRGELRLG